MASLINRLTSRGPEESKDKVHSLVIDCIENVDAVLSSESGLQPESVARLEGVVRQLLVIDQMGIKRNSKVDFLRNQTRATLLDRKVSMSSDEDNIALDWIVSEFLPSPTLNRSSTGSSTVEDEAQRTKSSRSHSLPGSDMPRKHTRRPTLTQLGELQNVLMVREVNQFLHTSAHTWEIDIFELDTLTQGRPLSVLAKYLFDKYDLFSKFNIPESNFANFISHIESEYIDNPYHNRLHAADVLASVDFFFQSGELKSCLRDTDILAGLIAAAIHDVGHPGTNNAFQIATQSELATRYNDVSVLENFHVSEAFAIMKAENRDIFGGFDPRVRKEIRSSIISMVLATDMSKHVEHVAELQVALEHKHESGSWFSADKNDERMLLLMLGLHAADLANPTKPFSIYNRWTSLVMEEFFRQGDKELELGLEVPPMNNRNTASVGKSQMWFIDFIVKPLYVLWAQIVPQASVCLDNITRNRVHWASLQALQAIRPVISNTISTPSVSSIAEEEEPKADS